MSFRRLCLLASISLTFGLADTGLVSTASAQDLGGFQQKVNLDLPLGVDSTNTEEDEDPPEVVNFYGANLEGDGFFYTIDRSGSMQDSGELGRAKQEISRNISEFSQKTQFAIVFFDAGLRKFPSSGRPVEANPGMKAAGLSFVNGIPGGAGSCMMQGLAEILAFANQGTSKYKVIVYIGDGGGTCMGSNENNYLQQMVATITSQNYQRIPINCVGVLMGTSRTMQENYMKQLVGANGGTYRRIN